MRTADSYQNADEGAAVRLRWSKTQTFLSQAVTTVLGRLHARFGSEAATHGLTLKNGSPSKYKPY